MKQKRQSIIKTSLKRLTVVILCLSLSMTILTGCGEWLWEDEEVTTNGGEEATSEDNQLAQKEEDSSEPITEVTTDVEVPIMNSLFSEEVVREKKVKVKGNGEDTVTILVYMNGSNLESDDGEATTDLSEMVAAGSSDKVNIVVQTMGTRSWEKKYGIAANRSQIYEVNGNGLKLVKDDLGQLDCTREKTLSDFIIWGAQNYPADRYALLFWNHGGGPVYGFGSDEWVKDEYAALTIDEMQSAFKTAGVYFDFIGMDCCIMSCVEVCMAFYDYCDYTILSEDFESGLGWSYTEWLKALYQNTSISTVELGKKICDSMVGANENSWGGDKSILAVIDESMMKILYTAWTDFAYSNESGLLDQNYSRKVIRTGRAHPLLDKETYRMSDYFVTDIMAVAENIDSEESKALAAACDQALVYVKACGSDTALTGLSVTLPYGDSSFYSDLKTIFTNCGIDKEYIDWLGNFVGTSGANDYYDYGEWDDQWSGWEDYYDDYDWTDWDYYDDEEYWNDDSWGWSVWDYILSWNNWYDDEDWSYDESNDPSYDGDDWYYGDDYSYDYDWFGNGDWSDDEYYYEDDDYWFDDSYDGWGDDGYYEYDDYYYDSNYDYDDGNYEYYEDEYYYYYYENNSGYDEYGDDDWWF